MSRNTTERHEPPRPIGDDAAPHLEIVADGVHDGLLLPLEPGKPIRIGRSLGAGLVIPESADSVSRQHAEVELQGDRQVELRDTNSSNGTFLNGRRVERQRLHDGDRIQLGVDVKLRMQWLTEEEVRRRLAAFLDDLTGCWNRRRFKMALHDHHARAVDLQQPLAMALLDVDHFKSFNTEHGFPCGDAVLQAVAGRLRELAGRPVYRLGGEEFGCLLVDADCDAAVELAERLREAVEAQGIEWEGRSLSVTASLGCACLGPDPQGASSELLRSADQGLRRAKEAGRNRVELPA